jgi:glycerophosphoryl diester phosphodiesterase
MSYVQRIDPFLEIKTPVLFAHRGGAKEVPESTEEAFRHAAIDVGVDVLELDIQVSKDKEIVVWHGPELSNVHDGRELFKNRDIRKEKYHNNLKGSAWVSHPCEMNDFTISPQRTLLTLKDFFDLVRKMENELKDAGQPRTFPINIELKPGLNNGEDWAPLWDKLFGLLDSEIENRKIILASAEHEILVSIRQEISIRGSKPYITNLSINEQLSFRRLMPGNLTSLLVRWFAPFIYKPKVPATIPYAFETYYRLVRGKLTKKVRGDQSAVYVFLTGVGCFSSIDGRSKKKLKKAMKELLKNRIDGVMTDYPQKVAKMLCKLKVRP